MRIWDLAKVNRIRHNIAINIVRGKNNE
jgi:hypothetical protein